MKEETNLQTFICSSADWELVVDAETHEEAASMAVQSQFDSNAEKFSVGAVISVIPVIKDTKKAQLVFAPSVLADIGMHKHASNLIKQIDKNV